MTRVSASYSFSNQFGLLHIFGTTSNSEPAKELFVPITNYPIIHPARLPFQPILIYIFLQSQEIEITGFTKSRPSKLPIWHLYIWRHNRMQRSNHEY